MQGSSAYNLNNGKLRSNLCSQKDNRRRSAAGGVVNNLMHLNSQSNYTPILQQEASITNNRFGKRLGTEPFVFSEGQMNTT